MNDPKTVKLLQRIAIGAFVFLFLVIAMTSCGGGESMKPATKPLRADTVTSCINKYGDFSKVWKNAPDNWKAAFTVGGWLSVSKSEDSATARRAAREATLVYSASGGRYLVTGPDKNVNFGRGTLDTLYSGSVRQIAECLESQ